MKLVIKKIIKKVAKIFFRPIYETRGTAAPITFKGLFLQKVIGINRAANWPTHFTSVISYPENINIGIGTAPGLSHGCYIQGKGKISIGDYTIIAPNVGIVSSNHDLYDLSSHKDSEVIIGKYCWIGMNSTILPGVELGDFTIVAAGAVVTKSFKEGAVVIAGNPAKVIKILDKQRLSYTKNRFEYRGFTKVVHPIK